MSTIKNHTKRQLYPQPMSDSHRIRVRPIPNIELPKVGPPYYVMHARDVLMFVEGWRGSERVLRVLHWLKVWAIVSLYGLGQFSHHELTSGLS